MSAPADSSQPARYVAGIDLGTTNSALAYVDTAVDPWQVVTFAIPQLVAPGQVEARETLPSFLYHPASGEFSAEALRLPWGEAAPPSAAGFFQNSAPVVGVLARDHGETAPGRLVASAKSWLCHPGVDRTADLLPWHGAKDAPRMSPLAASAAYLAHLRAAWNHRFPQHPLERQDVVLTLPASFDEVARELTVKAARAAGLPKVVLVEEPQAAFYAWIDAHRQDWETRVQPGQKILVCDIGGGTSDFTLIRVRRGSDAKVQFHRVAVGEHLILGGDNLDLALAHRLEQRLGGGSKLSPRQWGVLVQTARRVKETLLGFSPPEQLTVSIPGGGSKLIGGSLRVEITQPEAREVLVEGFLPRVSLNDKPQIRRSGFQEFGLPFAPDAAMTRYLAAFLTAHRHVSVPADAGIRPIESGDHDPARPDVVLLNGGFFAAPVLRERLLEAIASWFPSPAGQPVWQPLVLANERLDLAVARGAAYYGMVRRGEGVRIAAGLARSYYIGVESPSATGKASLSAMCLLPAGIDEGQEIALPQRFNLLIRQPAEFPLFVSSTRLTDPAGTLVPIDPEQIHALPPIRTVLNAGKKGAPAESLAVQLHAKLTEIGTLDLWCAECDGPRTWRLQFDVRSATQTDVTAHAGVGEQAGLVDQATLAACEELLKQTYLPPPGRAAASPEGLVKRLEHIIEARRTAWPPSLLRGLWEVLHECEPGRHRSAEHEARWLYLLGFSLRPGYGMAVDDWRVAQTWRMLTGKLAHRGAAGRIEGLILWRRIAGGLAAGQQQSLAEPLLANLPNLFAARGSRKGVGSGAHELAETVRLFGACELLPVALKAEIGDNLLARIPKEKTLALQEAMIWTVGRLGARVPMYGPLNSVPGAKRAAKWIESFLALREAPPATHFAVMQLARRTDDRYRDIPEKLRREVLSWLRAAGAGEHLSQLVSEVGQLQEDEQGQMFGESLPRGLRVM